MNILRILWNLIPIKFGEIKLKTNREGFADALVDLTEDDYPLIPIIIADTENLKDYGRNMYDNKFMLFKIQKSGRFYSLFFTTIHCRLVADNSTTTLKYHIRMNVYSNFLFLVMWVGTLYLIYESIFVSQEFSFKIWIILIIGHTLQIWNFRTSSKNDIDFLMKLVNYNSQSKNSQDIN